MLEMVKGRMGTCTNVARSVQQILEMQMSSHIIKRALHRASLRSQTKVKKTTSFFQNVKARLEFARVHEH